MVEFTANLIGGEVRHGFVPDIHQLTHGALWLLGEAVYKALKAIHHEQESINTKLGEIMAQVQVDDSVLTDAHDAIESLAGTVENLVKSVSDFLASPAAAAIPEGDVASLKASFGDAQTASTDATNAQAALQKTFPPLAPSETAAPTDGGESGSNASGAADSSVPSEASADSDTSTATS